MTERRPAVTVVLPFFGDADDARQAVAALTTLSTAPGDVLLLADNTADGTGEIAAQGTPVTVLRTEVVASAYAARNIGAGAATTEWLLFLDGDCHTRADLLDRYFDEPRDSSVGAVAGQVLGLEDQPGMVPAYIRSRRHLDQRFLVEEHVHRPMAVTANLLVRRRAWEEVGGFQEATRAGADADFCWRLQDAGWRLVFDEHAAVHHEHRATLGALLKQTERDGAGSLWSARRHPGFPQHPRLARELVRSVGGVLVWLVRGRPQRAAFKAIDGLWCLAAYWGAEGDNRAPTGLGRAATVLVVDAFPDGRAVGVTARVEARRRPVVPRWDGHRAVVAHWEEDEGLRPRLRALCRLAARRPAAVTRRVRRDGLAACLAVAPAARRLLDAPSARLLAERSRREDALRLADLAGLDPGVHAELPALGEC